jgi:DNA-binding beta-propeller fold protein YncE
MQSISSPVLRQIGYVALPEHRASGGFDHAAVHAASGHVYVAHTANDAVDVFDPVSQRHLYSVPQLRGVAGVLVSDEAQLIISSNRAENTIGIFPPGRDPQVSKVAVGVRPNGLAYDHVRGQILVANVGDPAIQGSHTLTVVAIDEGAVRAEIPVAGRTRWAIFDPEAQAFYVNISDPAEMGRNPLSGSPDVVFFDRVHKRLYVAAGDPGTIDVFDTKSMGKLGTVATEKGAHTFALAPVGNEVYAFLPQSHSAAIYQAGDM